MNSLAPVASWTCPTCERAVATPFCPGCGERPLIARELSLRGLFDKLFQALTSIDGKMVRTFRALLTRPGELTVAYTRGQRRPYIGPVQLFLLANVVFFGAQSITHLNVFSSPLSSHLNTQDWSLLAQQMVVHRLADRAQTLAQYATVFDRAAVFNAKWLVIVMALAFALVLPLVSLPRRRPFVAHVVFALHLYAFLLLLFSVALAVPAVSQLAGGNGLAAGPMDHVLSIAMLAACAVYLFFALGAAYGDAVVARVLKAALLAVCAGALVLGYRFLIFVFTLTFT
jgi:hypothetical protein